MNAVAKVRETELIPIAEPMTVAEAYESVKEFLDPGVEYEIDWSRRVPTDTTIFQRFKRDLDYEAWLIARPVSPGGQIVVAAMLFAGFPTEADEREFVETLAALKAADEAT